MRDVNPWCPWGEVWIVLACKLGSMENKMLTSRQQWFLERKPHSPCRLRMILWLSDEREMVFPREGSGKRMASCLMGESERGRKDPCVFLNITLEIKSHYCASSLFSKCLLHVCVLCAHQTLQPTLGILHYATWTRSLLAWSSCFLVEGKKQSRRNCDGNCQPPTNSRLSLPP